MPPPLFHHAAILPPSIPGETIPVLLVMTCLSTAATLATALLVWHLASRLDRVIGEENLIAAYDASAAASAVQAISARDEALFLARLTRDSRDFATATGPTDRSAALTERARRQADRDAPPRPLED